MKSIVGSAISLTLFFSLTVSAAAQSVPRNASSTDRRAIQRLFAAWNSRDADKVAAAFSNGAVYEDVAAGQVNRGRNEIREWVAGAFRDIENFKLEVVHSSFHKGGGIVEWVWRGTDKGLFKTGKSF